MSRHTSRSSLLGLAIMGVMVPLMAGPALALTSSQQQAIKSSCQSDYRAHCTSVSPGGTEALQCLQQNLSSLSAACQQAVTAATGAPASPAPASATPAPATAPPTAAATPPPSAKPATKPQTKAATPPPPPLTPRQEAMIIRQSCAADFRRYCGTVPMGGGNGVACLRANAARLSPGCKQALSAARR